MGDDGRQQHWLARCVRFIETSLRPSFLILFILMIAGFVIGTGWILVRWDGFWIHWRDYHEELRNLSIGFASTLGLLAGFYTLYNATRRTEAQNRSGDVDHRRETNERFARSIEMLGHKSSVIRLGGIYSLEGLANDGGADRKIAIDVLSAFARDDIHQSPGAPVTDDIRGAVHSLARLLNKKRP